MKRIYTPAIHALGILVSTTSVSAQTKSASSQPVVFSEISRKTVQLEDRKIIYVRVRPPALPYAPMQIAPAPTSSVSPEEEQVAAKPSVSLSLGATVYIGPNNSAITELRWHDDAGGVHTAWSSADFRYLTNFGSFESPTAVYQWFLMPTLLTVGAFSEVAVPPGIELSSTEVEYHVSSETKSDASHENTLNALDYIHAYYQWNYQQLKVAYEELKARVAEDEQQRVLNPPKPQNSTIRFWKIASPAALPNN